ncbi:NUDIX domain-containing protein [Photobacterium sp. 1_MG-2023]|uniref:NUDIX domain-containing protein n=1 Tax=Photobacterium sp. 1_MG-2023 TaxID=3062646 RepID=UPI0026E1EF97|nr:NUDIX domain-containing protein [Photobacterium sp. 1_MG-2023]MDO6708544.1 NUDIX domain-containing protein [Photobacterium sp. 1_MG-2023]
MTLHYSSRALIQIADQVLLVKRVGDSLSFLPGGHVDFAEAASATVAREIFEETGLEARIGALIGVAENDWVEGDQHQTEIALIFRATLVGRTEALPVVSREPHLEFFWARLSELDSYALHPVALRGILRAGTTQFEGFVASDLDA